MLRRFVPAAGFAVTLAAWFPGDMRDPDVVDQFQQSLTLHFRDWHPPVMAAVWSLFNRVWQGPQLMLILQLALYWVAVWCVLGAVDPSLSQGRRWIVAAVLCIPATSWIVAPIQKDVQLWTAWIFSASFVFWRRAVGRPPGVLSTALVLLAVLYGALVRHNAALVAGPIALYVLTGRPYAATTGRTIALYLAVAVAALGIDRALNAVLRVEHTAVVRALIAFDLIGISTHTHRNELPFPLTDEEFVRIVDCYDAASQEAYWYGACRFVWPNIEAESDAAMASAWARAVARHPVAYATHRAATYWHFVVRRPDETWSHVAISFFARPLPYVMWLIGLTWWAARRRDIDPFVWTAAIVSAMYLATYLPLAPGYGFRYVFLVVAFLIFATAVAGATATSS